MINKAFNGFWDRVWSVFETEKPDINEDISRMVLYMNKHYSPDERITLIHGVVKGIDESLKIECELFKIKYENAHTAHEKLNK
jgi:hypothetical protein